MDNTVPLQPVGFVLFGPLFCIASCLLLFSFVLCCCLLLVRVCCSFDCFRWRGVCSFVTFCVFFLFFWGGEGLCVVFFFILCCFKQQSAINQRRTKHTKTKQAVQVSPMRFPQCFWLWLLFGRVQVSPPLSGGTAMGKTVHVQPAAFLMCWLLFGFASCLLLFSFALCVLSFACSDLLFV